MRSDLAALLALCAQALFLTACDQLPTGREEQARDQSGDLKVRSVRSGRDLAGIKVLESFNVGSNVYVRSLMTDAERQALWVGTSAGVLEIDLAKREVRNTFTRAQGLANEYVFAIAVDSHANAWFGTNGGGMSRYGERGWKTFFPMHGLADYWVYSIAEHPDGSLWIGTWAGVNHLNPERESFATYVKELVNEWVYSIAIDARQRVWFGTEGGISMFDQGTWRSWTHADGLGAPNSDNLPISINTGLGTRSRHDLNVLVEGEPSYNPNYVFSILAAQDGSIWAGTWGGGVSRFDGETWRNYTHKDGLAGNIVYSLTQDREGVLWFGTNQGVSRYDGESWLTLGRRDGLFGDSVYALAAVQDDIWAGTREGVARIGIESNKTAVK